MSARKQDPFFVGYLSIPPGLRTFLIAISFALLGGFAAMSLMIGNAQDNPGDGAFRFDWGRQNLTGVLEARPYPILHVTKGSKRIPAGSTIMLSGGGKRGAQARAQRLDGQLVKVSGVTIKRGDIDMLQLRGGMRGVSKVKGAAPDTAVKDLGKWRLAGEICDGKCLAGAMRPGRGIAHKACANLCLIGGAPPVFVSTSPVNGREFFLLGTAEGKPLGAKMYDLVARYISLEGQIERRGNLHIFKVDLASLELMN